MNLLQLAAKVAIDVGLEQPTAVAAATDATDRSAVELKQVLDFVGEDLSRRVDWQALRSTTTVTGDGTALAHPLPSAYFRTIAGNAVKLTNTGATVRGGLSAEEFTSLAAVSGVPRFYLIGGPPGAKTISFWPHLANTFQATIIYQSMNWSPSSTAYASDADQALLPDQLMIKGAIARWRRQKGMDYPDYVAEYEAALANFAAFDDGARSP